MAKKFKFPLQRLLDIRQRQEDDRKQALAKVLSRLNEQTERARRYDEMIRQEHRSLRDGGLVGSIDVRRLAHHRLYVNSCIRGMVQALCDRAATQQASVQARQQLIEAVKGRKALDNLRHRRRGEWARRMDKIEAGELDEMGATVVRRAREGD